MSIPLRNITATMYLGTITTTLIVILLVECISGQSVSLFPYTNGNVPYRRTQRRFINNVSANFARRQNTRFPQFTNRMTLDPWWPYSSRQSAIREVERLQRIIQEARKNRPVYDYNGPLENFLPLPIGERFKPSPFRDSRANKPQLPVGPLSNEIKYAGDLIRAKAAAGYYGDKPLFDI